MIRSIQKQIHPIYNSKKGIFRVFLRKLLFFSSFRLVSLRHRKLGILPQFQDSKQSNYTVTVCALHESQVTLATCQNTLHKSAFNDFRNRGSALPEGISSVIYSVFYRVQESFVHLRAQWRLCNISKYSSYVYKYRRLVCKLLALVVTTLDTLIAGYDRREIRRRTNIFICFPRHRS